MYHRAVVRGEETPNDPTDMEEPAAMPKFITFFRSNETIGYIIWALGTVLLAGVLLIMLAVILTAGFGLINGTVDTPCWFGGDTIACKTYRVDECLTQTDYTLDQCVILVGDNHD